VGLKGVKFSFKIWVEIAGRWNRGGVFKWGF